ncbi:MAG TPA: IclR family transcriptional regulator, partial [Burkholderiaceae bacterium]|nr:IclR family transcriptional regulator [Burkholderiaceae bacterium]
LLCLAVLVPAPSGRSNLCLAVQAPSIRLSPQKALALLPALRRAATAIAAIDDATPPAAAKARA